MTVAFTKCPTRGSDKIKKYGSVRRFLCSRNPHFRKWSFDGRSRNHLTDPHEARERKESLRPGKSRTHRIT